mgnify:CR=1 FL=1
MLRHLRGRTNDNDKTAIRIGIRVLKVDLRRGVASSPEVLPVAKLDSEAVIIGIGIKRSIVAKSEAPRSGQMGAWLTAFWHDQRTRLLTVLSLSTVLLPTQVNEAYAATPTPTAVVGLPAGQAQAATPVVQSPGTLVPRATSGVPSVTLTPSIVTTASATATSALPAATPQPTRTPTATSAAGAAPISTKTSATPSVGPTVSALPASATATASATVLPTQTTTATPTPTATCTSDLLLDATATAVPTGTATPGPCPTIVTTEIPGNVSPLVARATLVSHADPAMPLTLTIALAPRAPSELDAHVKEIEHTHKYLSHTEFVEAHAPSQPDFDALQAFVGAHQGVRITKTSADRFDLQLRTTVGAAEALLSTAINVYEASGRRFYANATDPSLPAVLAPLVQHIGGLTNAPTLHPHSVVGSHDQGAPGAVPFAPTDIRSAYNIAPLLSQGMKGQGQTIGIVTFAPLNVSDVSQFDATYGVTPTSITVMNPDSQSCGAFGTVESTLDAEWSSALAPGADIQVFEDGGTCDFTSTLRAAVSSSASVISISWGGCEGAWMPSDMQAVDAVLAQGASTGKSIFVASGDSGSDDCGNGVPSVDFPASDPNVTAVGGTSLELTSAAAWLSETAWPGSGGGCSSVFSASWQGSTLCGTSRGAPDVSADADPNTGYDVYYSGSELSCASHICQIGGTSVAAPVWAGIMADINQGRVGRNPPLPAEGFANTDLYSAGHASSQPYHDITQGGNGQYSAGAGWDPVTGWGSPDADKLALSLGAIVGSGPLVASPLTLSPGATASVSWSIANPDAWDWVALYVPGAPDSSYLAFAFLGCSQSATSAPANGACSFTMPSTPGPYEFRLFTVTWNRLATSNQIAVS